MRDAIEEPRVFAPGDPFRHYHYVVEGFLGAGASGQVYDVRHRFTGVHFALKVIHLADRNHARRVARSLQEAQVAYSIRHANVVEVKDLGCEDDGLVWQIMELLDGLAVDQLMERYPRFSPLYAIDIAIECAWGLQAAHELQIVHRDVRPSNVFVTRTGRVKIIDFSLAKVVGSALKTTHGKPAKGSHGYMAPEHIRGSEPTSQFDVYALGVMLWQMLVGRHPFAASLGNPISIVQRHLTEELGSLATEAGLPAYCDEVVRRATAKDPAARYPGMWPFGQALLALRERLLADRGAAARVRFQPDWERRVPIVRGTEGSRRYGAPRPPAPAEAAPPVPSARVYVAPRTATPPLAPTVPMEAVTEAAVIAAAPEPVAGANFTPLAVAAPLTARRPAPRAHGRWAWVAVLVPVALAIGAGLWLLAGPVVSRPAAPPPLPSSGGAPPRAAPPPASAPVAAPPLASVAPPEPRRLPPVRLRR